MNKNRYALEITTVSRCSLGCEYCPQEKLSQNYPSKKPEKLSLSDYKEYLSKVPKGVEIHFSGFAEPFLNPDCGLMIDYTLSLGYKVVIYTTTIGMHDRDFEILKHNNIKDIVIHVPDGKYFKLSKKRLSEWIKDIKIFESLNINFKLILVGDFCAYPHINSVIRRLESRVISQPIISRAGNNANCFIASVGHIYCTKGKYRQPVLLSNGDISLCCNDYGLKHKLGNMKTNSYMDLFRSKEYTKILDGFKDDTIDTLCRTCEYGGAIN